MTYGEPCDYCKQKGRDWEPECEANKASPTERAAFEVWERHGNKGGWEVFAQLPDRRYWMMLAGGTHEPDPVPVTIETLTSPQALASAVSAHITSPAESMADAMADAIRAAWSRASRGEG